MENDYLLLKWGTLKGCDFENSPEAAEALKEYMHIGHSMSAMAQEDTPRQKELLCIMVDKVQGEVINDWSGEVYEDLEDAKAYIMNYGKKKNKP